MIIVGAKGLAKEVLEIFFQHNALDNLYFYDNVSTNVPERLFEKFPVLTSMDKVTAVFKETGDYHFTLGVGSPLARFMLANKFQEAGGILTSAISKNAFIGNYDNNIASGCTILDSAVITNGVSLGRGCLVNPHVSISHDSQLGNFVELAPGVRITGACGIDDFCVLGTNAVLLPKVRLGKNVIVGAGAVVTKDVPDNSLVVGIPAAVKRELPPLF